MDLNDYESAAIRMIGERMVRVPLAIHANSNSRNVVLIYPGYRGDMNGFNNKYVKIADDLVKKNVGAVVRTPNFEVPGEKYAETLCNNLNAVIKYVIDEDRSICKGSPHIHLMGISAGAGAVAAVASRYNYTVGKILLIAPAMDAGNAVNNLSRYVGEVYVTVGSDDEVVGARSGKFFFDLATSASTRKLKIIPNCDHQFRGTENGRILSKAPLWAFGNDETFPSPHGGIVLY